MQVRGKGDGADLVDTSNDALLLLLMAPSEVLRLAVVALGLRLALVDEALCVVVFELSDAPVALRLVLQLRVVHYVAV